MVSDRHEAPNGIGHLLEIYWLVLSSAQPFIGGKLILAIDDYLTLAVLALRSHGVARIVIVVPVPIWRGWNGRRRTVRATCGPTEPRSATFGLIWEHSGVV